VIQVEVLQAVSEEEGVPDLYREKARRVLEKLQAGESKELAHEATTMTYPLGRRGGAGAAATGDGWSARRGLVPRRWAPPRRPRFGSA
jgi:hypothetical protein